MDHKVAKGDKQDKIHPVCLHFIGKAKSGKTEANYVWIYFFVDKVWRKTGMHPERQESLC